MNGLFKRYTPYRGKRPRPRSWLAAGMLVLGAALYFIPATGMRFSGMLLMCAGIFFRVMTALRPLAEESRRVRRCLRTVWALFAAGVMLFAALELWVLGSDETDWTREPAAVIVLGAGVNGREPSLTLQRRLEAALEYIADKPTIPVVVTGGQGRGEEITEASCMAAWLLSHGVDAERVILEEQATDTRENLAFSRALLAAEGVDEGAAVAVVSNDYHLARAGVLFGGEEMIPVAATMPLRFLPLTVNYYVREAFALAEALLRTRMGG